MLATTTAFSVSCATAIVLVSYCGAATHSERSASCRSGSEATPDSSSTDVLSSNTSKTPTLANCAHGNCERGLLKTWPRIFSGRRSVSSEQDGDGVELNEADVITSGANHSPRQCRRLHRRQTCNDRRNSISPLLRRLRIINQRQTEEHSHCINQSSH